MDNPRTTEDLRERVLRLCTKEHATLSGHLGINYKILEKDLVVADLEIKKVHLQPFGIMHGGVSLALAESLASIGGWLNVDENRFNVVGLEINANHIRSVREGNIVGSARPLHRGGKTQIWEIHITDSSSRLVCISRCTLAVLPQSSA